MSTDWVVGHHGGVKRACRWRTSDTLLDPATTCAFVITRSGDITNPLPSNSFWQLGATLRTLTTLGAAAATTGLLASAGSGEATGITGVRLNGSSTAGSPEVFSSAESRLGTVFSQRRRHLVDLGEHPRTLDRGGQFGLVLRLGQRRGQQPGRGQHHHELDRHADDGVDGARIVPVTDRAAHRPSQHHAGDLTDDHQRQDQEQRGEQFGARRGDVADDVRRQQHTRHRAEQHADKRQHRTQRAPNASPRSRR